MLRGKWMKTPVMFNNRALKRMATDSSSGLKVALTLLNRTVADDCPRQNRR